MARRLCKEKRRCVNSGHHLDDAFGGSLSSFYQIRHSYHLLKIADNQKSNEGCPESQNHCCKLITRSSEMFVTAWGDHIPHLSGG